MKIFTLAAAAILALGGPAAWGADAVGDLQARYRSEGAGPFSAATGETLWKRKVDNAGGTRSCTSCHGTDLRQPGRHARTGKTIKPMAPSANPARLSDAAKIEKWFTRNCKWTLGRACTPQEKGDVLSFLKSQ